MRSVDRFSVGKPESLYGAKCAGVKELVKAREYFKPPPKEKPFNFSAYKESDVRQALEALFHGKCAYCEGRFDVTAPVDIEHFRPKNEVAGIDHPGYWWLAAEWTNLLPSCIDCNRRRKQLVPIGFASLRGGLEEAKRAGFVNISSGKGSCFPIAAAGTRMIAEPKLGTVDAAILAEQPLLLDPCRDDCSEHLRFHVDRSMPLGIVYPAGSNQIVLSPAADDDKAILQCEADARAAGVSVRGAVSILIFGLNRLALVQERTRVLRKLEFLGNLVIDLSATADELDTIAVEGRDDLIRNKAVARIRATVARSLAEIRSLAAPDAPFSEMAKAWIADFVSVAV